VRGSGISSRDVVSLMRAHEVLVTCRHGPFGERIRSCSTAVRPSTRWPATPCCQERPSRRRSGAGPHRRRCSCKAAASPLDVHPSSRRCNRLSARFGRCFFSFLVLSTANLFTFVLSRSLDGDARLLPCRLPPPVRAQGVQGDARAALVPDAGGHGSCRGLHPLVGEGPPRAPQVRACVDVPRASG
jgi:hypothetical protein